MNIHEHEQRAEPDKLQWLYWAQTNGLLSVRCCHLISATALSASFLVVVLISVGQFSMHISFNGPRVWTGHLP